MTSEFIIKISCVNQLKILLNIPIESKLPNL